MTPTPAVGRNGAVRLIPLAIVVGLATFAFSCLFVAPQTATWSLGDAYAGMSEDPFGQRGPFPHRVLGALLAHVIGLGGERFWLFHHGTVVAFLAFVFAIAVARGCSVAGGVVLAATVALTGAVELYKGHVGYPEPISYCLMMASVLLARRTGWFWLLQLLALLNHDNVLFFVPWLLWVRATANGGLRRVDAIAALAVVSCYLPARWALMGPSAEVYSVAFYLRDQKTAYAAGMWVLDVIAFSVNFGAVPTLLAWHAWFDGWRRAGAGTCLLVLGVFGMSWVAADLMRFTTFLVVPMVFAGIRLLQRPHGLAVLAGLAVVTKLAMWGQAGVGGLVFQTMGKYLPDPVSAVVPKVVPELWYVFIGYLAWYAAMVLVGRWYARRWPAGDPASAGAVVR